MKKKLNCVLLIDDDEPTNFLSKLVIEKSECTDSIQTASSGREALQYLTNSEKSCEENDTYPCPDLIFLNINMPAMNGWEFLQKYHALEKKHKGNVVLIMLTTSLNPDDKLKANEIPDITGFENKPLTAKKLEAVLKQYFPENY